MVKQTEDRDSRQGNLLKVLNKKTILIAVAVLVVVVLAVFAVLRSQGGSFSGVALRVGDEIIFQDEYNDYIKSAKKLNMNEEEAHDTLIEYHKNRIALSDMKIPAHKEVVDKQWDLVLSEISEDYLSSLQYEDELDSPAGQVLVLNRYVRVLEAEAHGQMYLGSLYHFPYFDRTKDREGVLAQDIYQRLQGLGEDLSEDVELAEEQITATTQTSASYTGLYLIRSDGAASKIGGSFGHRFGMIPEQINQELPEASLPYLSEVVDVDLSGFYIVRVVDSFDAGENIAQDIQDAKNKIRVVEYDR